MSFKVAFAGVKGAGASTSAFATAACLAGRGSVTFVEADPSGGSLLSRCDDLRAAGDLYDAAMSRDPGGLAGIVQRVGDVDVVPSWGQPFRTLQALSRPRVPWELLFDEVPGTVVVDLGRLSPGAPTLGVLHAMDVIVLVAPPEPGAVATTMEWSARGGRDSAGDIAVPVDRIVMITNEVVGRRTRRTVTPREMASLHGPPYLGHLPHDDAAVELLQRGASMQHKSLRRRPLAESAATIAAGLLARVVVTTREGADR